MQVIKSLIVKGLVKPDQVKEAVKLFKSSGISITESLIDLGYISETELTRFLSENLSVEIIDLNTLHIDQSVLDTIPEKVIKKKVVVPFETENSTLKVAMSDPTNLILIDELAFLSGFDIKPYIAPERSIKEFISKHYNVDKHDFKSDKNVNGIDGLLDEVIGFSREPDLEENMVDEIIGEIKQFNKQIRERSEDSAATAVEPSMGKSKQENYTENADKNLIVSNDNNTVEEVVITTPDPHAGFRSAVGETKEKIYGGEENESNGKEEDKALINGDRDFLSRVGDSLTGLFKNRDPKRKSVRDVSETNYGQKDGSGVADESYLNDVFGIKTAGREGGNQWLEVPKVQECFIVNTRESSDWDDSLRHFTNPDVNITNKKKKVLIADQDTVLKKIAGNALYQNGYDVHLCSDGLESLSVIYEKSPDLICLDIGLRGVSSFQISKILKANELTRHIPVLIMHKGTSVFGKLRGQFNGIDGYINKPLDMDKFIDYIKEIC